MKNSCFTLLALFLLSAPAQSEVKPKMDEMLGYIFDLKPFISSEAEYEDPQNAPRIKDTLNKMIMLSDKIKHDDKIKNSAKEVSALSMQAQFQDAAEIFEKGNKIYSLWVLRSNLANCVACHTQLPARSTNFGSEAKKKYLTNNFQEAEFLFIIRNFEKAIELYSLALAEYPKSKMGSQQLSTALTRKVYYFTRVKRDLPGLAESLRKDLKNKALPVSITKKMKAYADGAVTLAKEPVPQFKDDQALEVYAEKTLKNDLDGSFEYDDGLNNLRRLQLSGFLYEYLDKNPETALRPKIYYWLSFCESRWEKGPQDSLPEMYLRKCIFEFPKSDVAKKCYDEYDDIMTFGYTGSSGTHIPPEVQKELQDMRLKINGNKN